MLNITIFSRDRPMQLELLLRSMERRWLDLDRDLVRVLYKATSDKFRRGYDRLRDLHPEFHYLPETGFRAQTLALVDPGKPYTQFFVDDQVFLDDFALTNTQFELFGRHEQIAALSLRLGRNIRRCYTLNIPTRPPLMTADCCFDWTKCRGDWGYPMSLDGNIFRTADVLPIMRRTQWQTPNSLESALALSPLPKPYMVCYDESILINVPANRVGEFDNRSMDVSPSWLRDQFLASKRISMATFKGLVPQSPHVEIDYVLEDQP